MGYRPGLRLETSVAAHQGGHLLDALQRERRLTQGLHGDGHELHGVVVRCHAVGAERAAALAAVDDGPLAAPAHPYGHRLHDAAAVAGAVARLNVHMQAAQTVGAVVAVVAAGALRRAEPPTDLAGEGVAAGVCLVIALFKGFPFVFAVHVGSS